MIRDYCIFTQYGSPVPQNKRALLWALLCTDNGDCYAALASCFGWYDQSSLNTSSPSCANAVATASLMSAAVSTSCSAMASQRVPFSWITIVTSKRQQLLCRKHKPARFHLHADILKTTSGLKGCRHCLQERE